MARFSNLDYLNLSTDLRRIAVWLQDGDSALARKFIEIDKKNLEMISEKLAKRKSRLGLIGLEFWEKNRLRML